MLSRKVQAKVLRDIGVDEIVEAKNGIDAMRKLGELDFGVGLVLTDWNMPGMDGVTLIGEIRKSRQDLPVIVISSEFHPERVSQAFQAGASSYITKPFRKEVLARKIASVQGVADLRRRRSQTPTIEGDLEQLGFAELVGFLNFSRKTGELVVELETGEAGAAFAGGEVKDAWIGRFRSEQAFRALAKLQKGRFRFLEGAAPEQARISTPTMTLLMEAVQAIDEEESGSA